MVEVGSAPTKAYTPVTSCGQYATSSPFALMAPPPVPQLPLKPVPLLKAGGGGQTKQQDLGSSNAPNLATSCGTNLIHRRRHPLKCMRERMRSCVCMSACAYACANERVDYIQSFVSVDGRGSVSVCY